eukprot:s2889_g2.t1
MWQVPRVLDQLLHRSCGRTRPKTRSRVHFRSSTTVSGKDRCAQTCAAGWRFLNRQDLGLPGHQKVAETVFEDPEEAGIRPRLLVPLQSVLGLKALCEREYIRTETVTEMLNQCRTAYYKDPGASDLRMRREARTVSVEEELLYLREQLILAAEPEKQMLLASVQNYEVYYFNPPAYVDEDLKEYIMNCSRWTHKKLIEENYELQMKLAGQEDVFENVDFCLKGLLRRHGTYKVFKTMHNIVKNAKDLFNPEDMIRKKEMEEGLVSVLSLAAHGPDAMSFGIPETPCQGLKPIDELQAAVVELFPNLKAKEDNSGLLLTEIEELQQSVTQLRAELAKTKANSSSHVWAFARCGLEDLLEKERNRANELNRKCDEQKQLLEKPRAEEVEVVKKVDNEATLEELKQLKDSARPSEISSVHSPSYRKTAAKAAGRVRRGQVLAADPNKHLPKLDEAISDAEQLFQAAASLPAQQVVTKVQGATKQVVDKSGEEKALKELQQLRQELEALKAKLAAVEKTLVCSARKGPLPDDYEELKTRLERKIARIAELEAELDQTKRDLRAANRKVEEQDRRIALKDAEKAKQLSDLMEKLRKSEEEARRGKTWEGFAEAMWVGAKSPHDLKNKLGIKVEESEGEEEEEAEDAPSFMSRYAIRAKNSGKPRWMLLSEDFAGKPSRIAADAKLKSQKTEHMQNQAHQHVGSSFQAANALQFLRRAPSSPESRKPRGVRLQYGDTQEWYTPDASMGFGYGMGYGMGDGTPATPAPGGFSRQGSFQMGQTFTDGSAASPGGPRFLTSQGSMTFSGDASPQRQGTASMAGLGMRSSGSPMMGSPMMGSPMVGSPTMGGNSRQGTPPLVHALGMPGSGLGPKTSHAGAASHDMRCWVYRQARRSRRRGARGEHGWPVRRSSGKGDDQCYRPAALWTEAPASIGTLLRKRGRVSEHAEGVAGWAKALSSLPAFSADQPSDIVLSNPLALEDGVDILGARESMGVVRFEAVPGMHSTPLAQGTGSSSLSVSGLSGPASASATSPSGLGLGAEGAAMSTAAGLRLLFFDDEDDGDDEDEASDGDRSGESENCNEEKENEDSNDGDRDDICWE